MDLMITREEINRVRRRLMSFGDEDATLDEQGFGHPDRQVDFTIRPVSEEWRLRGRKPAYRTARANVQYIWRQGEGADRFGAMPRWFGERTYDLRAAGLMLPNSAPQWAWQDYEVWDRIDAATEATGDPTDVSAWHILAELPAKSDPQHWEWLARSYVQRHLITRGAAVAYAIHALAGPCGEWVIAPHVHLIVAARRYRTGAGHGQRMASWAGSWQAQWRLDKAWRLMCGHPAALQRGNVARATSIEGSRLFC